MKKIGSVFLSFFILSIAFAQNTTVQQYIDAYKDIAIREMKRMGIPASITLAQGILETESGNGELVKKSNNHFGIKCKSSWSGGSVSHDDDAAGECFRKYNNAEDSYRDHSNFLRGNERYAFLFRLNPADYKGWAYGLKRAGYATNPAYPDILIKNIEQYNLQQYSLQGLNEVPVFDAGKYADDKPEDAATQADTTSAGFTEIIKKGRTAFMGCRAVFAARGTSLLAIATNYDIALSRLLEFNDLNTDGLLPEDQWIFLEKKSRLGRDDSYITQKEETAYDIAQQNAIQLSSLLQYNSGLNKEEMIKPGTKVFLKPPAEVSFNAESSHVKFHEVLPKEGLYAISKKYNITIEEIKEWNNLTSDDLKVGQKLIIAK